MVRLYSYQNYHWNLINNTIDDTYQAITDFYYGTGMYKQYGEIKKLSRNGMKLGKMRPNLIQKVFICFKQKQELLYLLKIRFLKERWRYTIGSINYEFVFL